MNKEPVITITLKEYEQLTLNHKQLKDIEKMAISNSNLMQENKQLKARIDKAIECIEYYAIENEDYTKIYNNEEIELLQILKGESK